MNVELYPQNLFVSVEREQATYLHTEDLTRVLASQAAAFTTSVSKVGVNKGRTVKLERRVPADDKVTV